MEGITRGVTICPYCDRANDAHAQTHDVQSGPEDGDVSICWQCHGISFFDSTQKGGLRQPDVQELFDLSTNREVQNAIHAMKESYTPSQAAAMTKPMPIDFNE